MIDDFNRHENTNLSLDQPWSLRIDAIGMERGQPS
jgi:hypothetical protein